MEEALKKPDLGTGGTVLPAEALALVPAPTQEQVQTIPRYNGRHGPVKNLFKPSFIKEIGVPLFQKLCEKHSPQLFQLIKDFKENEANKLVETVRREDAPNPGTEFLNILPWIISLLDDEGFELLIDAGATMQPDEHRGAFVARTWLSQPELFHAATMRRRSSNATSRKRYGMYRPSKPLNNIALQRLDDTKAAELGVRCSQHFVDQRCGPTATVWLINEPGKIGVIIDRGSQKKSKGHIDSNEKSITTVLRDEKTDVAFFDHDTQTLWIAAAATGMTAFYARLLGEYLFGDSELFSVKVAFDLDFALTHELKEKLASCTGDRIVAVRMKSRKINLNDGSGVEPTHKVYSRGECVSEKVPLRQNQFPGATVASVSLEVELIGTKPIFETLAITNNAVQSGLHLSDEELQKILARLGIFSGDANA